MLFVMMNDIIWRHTCAQVSEWFFRGIFMIIVKIWKKTKVDNLITGPYGLM